ncbi:MAG TPA: FecR family protein [Pseudomonadales bacterium]|nr:FecR family protein [Pseudomonadales bacterium]
MSFALRSASRWKFRDEALLSCVLFLLFIAAASPARAATADPVGRITVKLNVVEAIAADGTVRTLNRTDPVYEGDTLRTGPRGRAQVRFTDRGLMSLRPGTELVIDDYEFSAASPGTSRQSMNLSSGGFRTMTGRIADSNRSAYRVSTPLAVIGVRGTIWDAFQEAGGALLLGVGQGAITATTAAGQEASIGQGAGYNYVRVNTDGSVEFLIEAPSQLDNSPDIDEEGDEEGDGADLGDAEDSSVAGGGGESESTAGTLGTSGTQVVETTNNPESTGVISQSNTGDGSLPVASVLSAADVTALIDGTAVGIIAGVSSSDLDANGAFILGSDRIGVGSGLAAFDANGNPLLVGGLGVSGFGPLFQTATRAELLGLAEGVLTSRSGGASNVFSGGTFQPAGGAAGVTWGSFAQPVRIFTDASDDTQFVGTTGAPDILYAIGTPTDVASLTGTASYALVDSRVVTTGGNQFFDLFADAFLDFGTGDISGILDVGITDTASSEPRYFYIVDWQGSVQKGLLTDVVLTNAFLSDSFTATETPANGEITGFLSGTGGEFLNLGFSYYVDGDPNLDVSGLVLLQAGQLPANALTPAETLLLSQGFGFVVAECCVTGFDGGGSGYGLISDPRPSSGLDAVIGVNIDALGDVLDPFDPLLNTFPPNAVVRRGGSAVVNYQAFLGSSGADLSTFEWQGFNGGPVVLYDSVTGTEIDQVTGNLLFLAGRLADITTLTGTGRYASSNLEQGFLTTATSAQPLQGGSISFNVDFATGDIFGGLARLFTDVDDIGLEAVARDRIDAFFDGQVALANDSPFVDFNIFDGFAIDSDNDTGGFGVLNIADSSMAGFFAGDGKEFSLAFSLGTEPDPADPLSTHVPVSAVGVSILSLQDLRLTAAEITQFQQGRVFVAAACCTFDSGTGAGLSSDPAIVGGIVTNEDFVLGLNVDALGNDLGPLDPGFLDPNSVEQIGRRANAFAGVTATFPVPPEIQLVAGSLAGPFGNEALLVDASTGQIIDSLGEELLFLTGFPASIATLQAAGFTTFSGASNVVSQGIQTLGGFATTNRELIDPAVVFAPGASVSFNVNLANGQVTNGHLFALQQIDAAGPFPEEFGFRVFFDGQVGYANNNTFIDVNIIDGAFEELGAIDIAESDIEIFLAGNGPTNFIGLGAYNLKSADATPVVAAGTFSFGNGLLPETRLTAADALQLSSPGKVRLGLAAFSRLQFGFPGILPIGAEGLLLGRAGDAAVAAPSFLLGANALYVVDDGTGPVPTNTARRGFYDQPFDFVLRKDGAIDSMVFAANANVIPAGGADFSAQGFQVSWGAWDTPGSGAGARIQDDPNNAINGVVVDREVFFASVNPTPQSQMPVTGAFSFGGAAPGIAAVLGGGVGNISGQTVTTPFNNFAVGFNVDFGSGQITNGVLAADYNAAGMGVVGWNAGFDGFVNGAIADLQVNNLAVTFDGAPQMISPPDPFANNVSGIFTGPTGERFLGGFSLQADVIGSSFESIQGVFVIDRN